MYKENMYLLYILYTIIVLMSAFFSTNNAASKFIEIPQNKSVIEGESVEFKCQASLTNGLEYSWMLNGIPIIQNERVFQIGSNLKILNTNRLLDNGNYVCIATSQNSGAREATPSAYLNILWISAPIVKFKISDKYPNDVILKCLVEGSEIIEVDWFRNGKLLKKSSHYDIQNKKLQIIKATVADNGVYRCIASNDADTITNRKDFILKLADKNYPEIDIIPENRIVQIGKTTSLHCSYKNSEKTEWIHDNNLLNNSKSVQIDRNGTLILSNVKQQNEGIYLCRGKRGDKYQEFSSEISVMNSVRITKPPANTLSLENEQLILSCDFSQKKKKDERTSEFTVRWRKDGKFFREAEINGRFFTTAQPDINSETLLRDEPRVYVNGKNGSLIFISTTVTDKGVYDCQILNNGNEIVTSNKAELRIIEALKFSPQPTSKNLELGSVSKVHCKAHGTPQPQIKWIQETNIELPETIEDINGTLFFRNVSAEHKGNYTCIASNVQGTINATVTITIVVAPRFSVFPESQIHAIEMSTLMINCQAIGDPKPTIQWDKDLEYLNNNSSDDNRFEILENGTLFISEVHPEDEGKYGCTIGNSGGLKREEVRLTVKPTEAIIQEESTALFMIIRAILITMSVAFAYIVFVVVLMVWCRYKRQARKERLNLLAKENGDTGDCQDINNKDDEIEPCLPDKSDNSIKKNNKKKITNEQQQQQQKSGDDTGCSVNSKLSKKSLNFDEIIILRKNLIQVHQLGRGEFGDVLIMKYKRIKPLENGDIKKFINTEHDNNIKETILNDKNNDDDINEIKPDENELVDLVLVKNLKKIKDDTACMEFRRQLDMFRIVSHKNVTKLFGLCRDDGPHSMILEWTDWGDLKQFLMATAKVGSTETNGISSAAGSKPPQLKIAQILAAAHQIASGMDSIYRSKFIHKDLAARNCIISSNFTVKVSYPSLSKDKYNREYFKHRNQLLPIRWMPPESISDDDFSTKSDVFSYGVLIWEIFTQAIKIPFEDKTNEDYINLSLAGQLEWSVGDNTPDDLKTILTSCWLKNPKERPSFSQLITALTNCLQSEYPKEQEES